MTKTITTKRCRHCNAWIIPGTFSQGSCEYGPGGHHNFVTRTREVEVAPRTRYADSSDCPCGSHGVFCPLSPDGEGPHRGGY